MTTKDYSLDGLNKFLDYAMNKGLLKKNTAQSRKRAANKILSVLEPNEINDLREVDVQHAFERFANLQGTSFKPSSLQVYLSRLNSALTDFFSYVDSPATFKPAGMQRNSSKSRGNDQKQNKTAKKAAIQPRPDSSSHSAHDDYHSEKHIVIPVPLRHGLTVKINNIPPDLTRLEAEKLAAVVRAYAVPEEK